MTDCLLIVLEDLREYGKQIPLYEHDRRAGWFDALAEVLVQLPREDRGGPATMENLQTFCRTCNCSKGAR